MRRYHEQCLRNLQDKMLILGFEEFDVFLVIGVVLGLQLFKVQTIVIWIVGGVLAGVLRFFEARVSHQSFWNMRLNGFLSQRFTQELSSPYLMLLKDGKLRLN